MPSTSSTKRSLIGEELFELSESFQAILKNEEQKAILKVGGSTYQVIYRAEEKLLYLFDITEQVEIESLYYQDRTVLGIMLSRQL